MSGERFVSATVEAPPVTLLRDAAVRDGVVVLEFRLRTGGRSYPVRIDQPLPEGLDVADADFRPGAAPDEWALVEGSVRIDADVPGGGRTLVLGLSTAPDATVPETFAPPTLSLRDTTGGDEDGATQGADPETLDEAIRRVEAGEAPGPDLSDRIPDAKEPDDEGAAVTREQVAERNEELMWLRARAAVAEREREQLRATVRDLRDALAEVDGVDADSLPVPDDDS